MQKIDFRSDTVTKPTAKMREAMMTAEVGDDVFREDPTTLKLEAYAADLVGQEAALFVSSGTLANLLAIMVLSQRSTEILMHKDAHTMAHELSGMASIAGAKPIAVAGERGILRPSALDKAIHRQAFYYEEVTSLVIIENSHNFCGGTTWTLDELRAVTTWAKANNLPIHMDGARLFNACLAQNISIKEASANFTSLMFCLNKGLGCPAGSMLCGSKEFISKALRYRKLLGGGMRQTGILAAAGLYALENHVERLKEDHQHAQYLVKALNESSFAKCVTPVETNLVFAETNVAATKVVEALAKQGILSLTTGEKQIRLVTHLDVTEAMVLESCRIIKELKVQ